MIKHKYISLLFLPIVLALGCKKEMMSYEGSIGVYFAVQHGDSYFNESVWPFSPTTTINFVSTDSSELTCQLKVMITGPTANHDRHFELRVNEDSTTAVLGTHYTALPTSIVMPAGATTAYIPVHLIRTTDLQEKERTLCIQLVASEDFDLAFTEFHAPPELTAGPVVPVFDASMHTIHMNDLLVQPTVWIGSIQEAGRESGQWGAFSRKKMDLITEVTGIAYSEFNSKETMPSVRSNLVTQQMQQYLLNKFNEGDPVLEDDGRLMWMGAVPWTSYVGVPWVQE